MSETKTATTPNDLPREAPEAPVVQASDPGPRESEWPEERSIGEWSSFWRWFMHGGFGSSPGWRRIVDRWFVAHIITGSALAWLVPSATPLSDLAGVAVLPLAGIFIGLAFAWVGNIVGLISDSKFRRVARQRAGGIREYSFAFQLSVLLLLATLAAWGIAAFGVFDPMMGWDTFSFLVAKAVLFGAASASLRECWQIILATQKMVIAAELVDHLDESHAGDSD